MQRVNVFPCLKILNIYGVNDRQCNLMFRILLFECLETLIFEI